MQLKGVSKLLGLDYRILYRKGAEIRQLMLFKEDLRESNALLLRLLATTLLQPTWMSSLAASYTGDVQASNLLSQLAIDTNEHEGYTLKRGILY